MLEFPNDILKEVGFARAFQRAAVEWEDAELLNGQEFSVAVLSPFSRRYSCL
jgi:hypothetical protein